MSKNREIQGGEKDLLLAAALIREVIKDPCADPTVLSSFLYTSRPEDRKRLRRNAEYAVVAAKAPSLVPDYFDREPADFFDAPPEVLGVPANKSSWRVDRDGEISIQSLCEYYFENELLYRLFKIMHGDLGGVSQLGEDTNWVVFKASVKVDVYLF